MMTVSMKKLLLLVLLLAVIFLIGGFGGVFVDRYLIPKLAAVPALSGNWFLEKATERTTIINKTEQVVIREDDSVERIISQPATTVVNIITLYNNAPTAGTRETATEVAGTSQAETRTGVLLTNDGLIVTYANQSPEVPGARYSALLYDGKNYGARFVGYDVLTNLAYFHLEENITVPAIALANSDDARIGKRLIALGNSFAEYQNRLTIGALQNTNRTFNLSAQTVSSSEKWEGVFEMEIPSAKNFVGGPVIGYNGEMVGLVGLVTFDNEPIEFILPSNVVRASYERFLSGNLSKQVSLGVYYLPITKAYALGQGLSRDRGALVYSSSGQTGLAVLAGSPASQAGIRAGDIITSVNGVEINLDTPLPELLSRLNKGEQAKFQLTRGTEEIDLTIQF